MKPRDKAKGIFYVRRKRQRLNKGHKLKSISWSDIGKIYKNRPKYKTVDHIIPLKHPKVSGLHVPWNMQYLSDKENSEKGNDFDGTYDNVSWRKNDKR